ncbi:MAG: hypothetical protein ACLRSW_15685 [Christensenellaceae bacterium]
MPAPRQKPRDHHGGRTDGRARFRNGKAGVRHPENCRNRLVIVVSHDREFAELAGDRVIELKDGKLFPTLPKRRKKARPERQSSAAGDTLCVKSGAELTAADFEEIRPYRKQRAASSSRGEKDVKTFKQAARLTDDGRKRYSKRPPPDATPKKNYSRRKASFIRSKLPVRHAVKIGVSGLKAKPVRLFHHSLCMVSFVMFGLLSTMMVYDESATLKRVCSTPIIPPCS